MVFAPGRLSLREQKKGRELHMWDARARTSLAQRQLGVEPTHSAEAERARELRANLGLLQQWWEVLWAILVDAGRPGLAWGRWITRTWVLLLMERWVAGARGAGPGCPHWSWRAKIRLCSKSAGSAGRQNGRAGPAPPACRAALHMRTDWHDANADSHCHPEDANADSHCHPYVAVMSYTGAAGVGVCARDQEDGPRPWLVKDAGPWDDCAGDQGGGPWEVAVLMVEVVAVVAVVGAAALALLAESLRTAAAMEAVAECGGEAAASRMMGRAEGSWYALRVHACVHACV
eukprot:1146041-Pelagomonas_calceolata.AAC.27